MGVRIDVSLSRKAVFGVIRRRIEAGESVTLEAIAAEIGCNQSTVWRAVKDLKSVGKLRMTQRGARFAPTR
jgi:DNA-binding IclR family transcriptional regulator